MASDTDACLSGVWGASPSDVFAVGETAKYTGTVLHYDGTSWTTMASTPELLIGVWGASPSDVFAVGVIQDGNASGPEIAHYDGTFWTEMTSPNYHLYAVWGTSPADAASAASSAY